MRFIVELMEEQKGPSLSATTHNLVFANKDDLKHWTRIVVGSTKKSPAANKES